MKIEDIVACFLKCNDHDWMNLQLVQVKYCCFFRGGGCEGVGRAGRGWNAGNAVECGLRCCGGETERTGRVGCAGLGRGDTAVSRSGHSEPATLRNNTPPPHTCSNTQSHCLQ